MRNALTGAPVNWERMVFPLLLVILRIIVLSKLLHTPMPTLGHTWLLLVKRVPLYSGGINERVGEKMVLLYYLIYIYIYIYVLATNVCVRACVRACMYVCMYVACYGHLLSSCVYCGYSSMENTANLNATLNQAPILSRNPESRLWTTLAHHDFFVGFTWRSISVV